MGALDKKLRDRMQLEVVDILERVGVTCVMVTHDQEEAMTMAGRIAIMNRGKFVQIGEPEEIYEHPTTRYSAEFIGSVNVFEGLLKERQEDGAQLQNEHRYRKGQPTWGDEVSLCWDADSCVVLTV